LKEDDLEKVLVEAHGAVRTVTLNRPEKRNALDSDMLNGLAAAFRAQPAAAERVLVLRANGPVFCAGLDLRERLGEGATGSASPIEHVLELVEHYPLPVVAIVQGDAIAGGNELALHCDFVVASTKASFGMSLAQIGLAPTWFLAKKLLEVAGPVATREVLLIGDPIPAARMAELGIIARAVPPDELEAAANAIIERLAANAPLSLRAMKALLVREMAFRDQIAHEDIDRMVDLARKSADSREGIAARLEKRAPRFEGR
jgi:enoyl-CoA hydratase/carnithine racemase